MVCEKRYSLLRFPDGIWNYVSVHSNLKQIWFMLTQNKCLNEMKKGRKT